MEGGIAVMSEAGIMDFDEVVEKITRNYISDEVFVTKENRRLPGRSNIIILIKRLRALMFPGYFEEKTLHPWMRNILPAIRLTASAKSCASR